MALYPKTFNDLIECYKKLPGIGEKNAERLAFATLELDDEIIEVFSNSIKNIKSKTKNCLICNNLSEEDQCTICSDESRNKKIICVVENTKNLVIFEKTGAFNGVYHVLGGLISPLDGINPEDINLEKLFKRVEEEPIEEIILALKPSVEGETTALYIQKKLQNKNVKVTKIAYGVPLGTDMEYIDAMTLEIALSNRS
ncbi:MAG: recombination mediator RecR [Erysipelotrichaceae bacterium]|nr:recombination mediator RecR [Erysipelotrichaceae bacterium]